MSHNGGTQGMAVSNYKADEKEAARNRKRLQTLIKKPENQICLDCPMKRTQCPLIALHASPRQQRPQSAS